MNKTTLNKEIKRYTENKDFKTAKNLVKSFGQQVEGFEIGKAIEEIEKAEKAEKMEVE